MKKTTNGSITARTILIVLFAAFLAADFATARTRKSQRRNRNKGEKWSRIDFETLGISFELPDSWSQELTDGRSRLLAREKPGKPIVALLSVYANVANTAFSTVVDHHRTTTLPGSFPGSSFLGDEAMQIGEEEIEAHFFCLSKLGSGQPASELFEALVNANDNRYVFISLFFAPGQANDYQPVFDRICKTLRILENPEPDFGHESSETQFVPAHSGQIHWRRSFDEAFAEAKKRNVPVLICFNMDNENVCETIIKTHYQDGEIVALSQRMVCLIASAFDHDSGGGPCPRFGDLKCSEHRDVDIRVREKYIRSSVAVAPQHVMCSPNGHLLSRREYMLPKMDLGRMMEGAIRATERRSRYFQEGKIPDFFAVYRTSTSPEERKQVIGDILFLGDDALVRQLFDRIASHRKVEGLVEAMEGISYCRHPAGVSHAIRYLDNPSEFVRAEAASALRTLAVSEAIDGLKKRLKRERLTKVKTSLLRALGTCGSEDESVARMLTKQATRGASALRIHALLALKSFQTNKDLGKSLVSTYQNDRNHGVKSAAALLLGYHRIEAAVDPMKRNLEGVGHTRLATITRWALSCIEEKTDPDLKFDDFAQSLGRDSLP